MEKQLKLNGYRYEKNDKITPRLLFSNYLNLIYFASGPVSSFRFFIDPHHNPGQTFLYGENLVQWHHSLQDQFIQVDDGEEPFHSEKYCYSMSLLDGTSKAKIFWTINVVHAWRIEKTSRKICMALPLNRLAPATKLIVPI